MVDQEQVALRPAVEISYLPKKMQKTLCEIMDMEPVSYTHLDVYKRQGHIQT